MSFVDSIERLCNEKNISISKMLSDLGLAKGLVSNWKKRGTVPSGDILLKIADYFDVSTDYLLGIDFTASSETSEKTVPQERPLTKKQEQVLSLAKNLSDEDMKKLIDYAELLTKAKNQ